MASVAIASDYSAALRICRVAGIDRGKTITRCEPCGTADLIPGIVLVCILLLPDVREVELPALGSIRIRLKRQEDDIARLQTAVVHLEQLNAQEQSVSITIGHLREPTSLSEVGHHRSNIRAKPLDSRRARE